MKDVFCETKNWATLQPTFLKWNKSQRTTKKSAILKPNWTSLETTCRAKSNNRVFLDVFFDPNFSCLLVRSLDVVHCNVLSTPKNLQRWSVDPPEIVETFPGMLQFKYIYNIYIYTYIKNLGVVDCSLYMLYSPHISFPDSYATPQSLVFLGGGKKSLKKVSPSFWITGGVWGCPR